MDDSELINLLTMKIESAKKAKRYLAELIEQTKTIKHVNKTIVKGEFSETNMLQKIHADLMATIVFFDSIEKAAKHDREKLNGQA